MDTNTFGFVKFEKLCQEKGVRPLFGLRAIMCDTQIKTRSKYETCNKSEEVYFIARTQKGISDLYKLYSLSTKQKYYFNRLYAKNLGGMEVIFISDKFNHTDYKKDDICIPWAQSSKLDD